MRTVRTIVVLLSLLGFVTSCARIAADADSGESTALLEQARADRATAQAALAEAVRETMPAAPEWARLDPADEAVHSQLETVVDLSAMRRETPFNRAIEMLSTSVEPPLNIIVLWRDMLENAQIDPTTPVEMQGPASIRLDVALKNLCRSLSNPLLGIEVDYVMDGGAIVVCTTDSLPQRHMEMQVHKVPAPLRADGRAAELVYVIQETVAPDSWGAMSERGQGTISACGDASLIVRQTPDVHMRIHRLLQSVAENSPVAMPISVSETTLKEQLQFLVSYRDTLEKELDRLHDHETQRQMMNRSSQDTAGDLQAIINGLEAFKRDTAMKDSNSPGISLLDVIIGRARQCLERCNPSGSPSTGAYGGLSWLSRPSQPWNSPPRDADMLAMRLAAKQGELRRVSLRIAAIQDTMMGRSRLDPEVRRIRAAAKRLEEADTRVQELEKRVGTGTAGRHGPQAPSPPTSRNGYGGR